MLTADYCTLTVKCCCNTVGNNILNLGMLLGVRNSSFFSTDYNGICYTVRKMLLKTG